MILTPTALPWLWRISRRVVTHNHHRRMFEVLLADLEQYFQALAQTPAAVLRLRIRSSISCLPVPLSALPSNASLAVPLNGSVPVRTGFPPRCGRTRLKASHSPVDCPGERGHSCTYWHTACVSTKTAILAHQGFLIGNPVTCCQ